MASLTVKMLRGLDLILIKTLFKSQLISFAGIVSFESSSFLLREAFSFVDK